MTRLLESSKLNLGHVPVQRLGDLLLWHCPDNLLHHLSVLEHQQRRNPSDVVASRRIHRFIHVQFHHFELASIIVRNFRHRRRQHVARPAPLPPQIPHHRLDTTRRKNFNFEISIGCCLNRIISHVLFSQQLALRPPPISPQSS